MGMFDNLNCKYPLPVTGANELSFQTKDTPSQFMDLYEIREDGTLWHEEYDIEDRGDKSAEPGSLERVIGCMTRVNERWVQMLDYTGEIVFYTFPNNDSSCGGWLEFSAYFADGKLLHLKTLRNEPAKLQEAL